MNTNIKRYLVICMVENRFYILMYACKSVLQHLPQSIHLQSNYFLNGSNVLVDFQIFQNIFLFSCFTTVETFHCLKNKIIDNINFQLV